jgi:HlyD family secretion protein
MNKKIVIVVAVAAAAALAGWMSSRPGKDSDDLVLYGNVDLRQVALAFNGAERVSAMHVEEGQPVKAGQVLAELDTRSVQLRLTQARAQADVQRHVLRRLQAGSRPEELGQAKAGAAALQAEAVQARDHAERLQALQRSTGGRGVSQQDVDSAVARSKAAQARLDVASKSLQLVAKGPRHEDIAQAQAQLDAAMAATALIEQQLADATLKAPVNAVVRARLMEPGDMASPQRPVYTLALTDPKWVRTYVTEAELGNIKPGMTAQISIDSLKDQTLTGKVGYISSVAEFTPKTVQTEELRTALVYEVRVLAEDRQDRLRMGMPATVRIALARTGQ